MIKKVKKISDLEVHVLACKARVDARLIKEIAVRVLKEEGIRKSFVSIVFVSDPAIRKLNKKYLSKDSVTDVLSFDLKRPGTPPAYLCADIVISSDTARALSRQLSVPYQEELCRYVVHGILHLTGYDDLTPKDKKIMWRRQEGLLKKIFPRADR